MGGCELRSTAKALLLLGRANANDRVAIAALITALQGLLQATAELREAQSRTAQALAARQAETEMRAAAQGVRTEVPGELASTMTKSINDSTRGVKGEVDRRRGR